MKTQLYLLILLRIIILFSIPILLSQLNWHKIYGDVHISDPKDYKGDCDREWNWSLSHFWGNVGFSFLFLVSLIDAIVFCFRKTYKYYPELK